ncbi:peptidase S28 [Dichotomopilus funicola]|uniref:Peptidase S28 n=1 Tax=Dichotomopilus funicola TaxID=1934379 RepID=A0AAN6ZM70_9PEZI|nr:peptidase S28 [Dichotomopilus funicola]
MKLPAGAILPLAPWIAPRPLPHGAIQDQDQLSSASLDRESARAVVRAAGAASTCEWFEQPIDHKNASLGSWQQLYCVNPEWWAGPGSPVVIMTPGDEPITTSINSGYGYSYLMNTTLAGTYAQELGAASVVVEHRYFGGSSPYDGFDSKTLQYLTMEQSAADMVNFAQNVALPFDKNKTSVASKAPWIYYGASYSATLGSWIEHFYPNVYHAYHLSSATVEANTDNWYYYDTIRQGIDTYRGDTSCSLALTEVASFVDSFLLAETANENATAAVKELFGATFPIADDDFAYAIATPFRYWQETGGYQEVLNICDSLLASNGTQEHDILGTIPATVQNYATYFQLNFRDSTCTYFDVWGQEDPLWCLNTHDLLNPFFEARTLGNPWRTWYWFLCNEPLASWATAVPADQASSSPPSLVSRKIDSEYWQRQCEMHFPPVEGKKYGSSDGRTPETLNEETGGWLRESTRVIWTSGEFDPWRATTILSESRPGGPLVSSDNAVTFVIKNAQHADDAFTEQALVNLNIKINPDVTKVQQQSLEIMKKWVGEFVPSDGSGSGEEE